MFSWAVGKLLLSVVGSFLPFPAPWIWRLSTSLEYVQKLWPSHQESFAGNLPDAKKSWIRYWREVEVSWPFEIRGRRFRGHKEPRRVIEILLGIASRCHRRNATGDRRDWIHDFQRSLGLEGLLFVGDDRAKPHRDRADRRKRAAWSRTSFSHRMKRKQWNEHRSWRWEDRQKWESVLRSSLVCRYPMERREQRPVVTSIPGWEEEKACDVIHRRILWWIEKNLFCLKSFP